MLSATATRDRVTSIATPAVTAKRLGQTIQSTVSADAAPCDPVGWDALAPCRPFSFTAPQSGFLVIVISWNGGPELDATIVEPNDRYLASSTQGPGAEDITLTAAVEANVRYEIRVNSYYSGQVFLLRADLQSAMRQ